MENKGGKQPDTVRYSVHLHKMLYGNYQSHRT